MGPKSWLSFSLPFMLNFYKVTFLWPIPPTSPPTKMRRRRTTPTNMIRMTIMGMMTVMRMMTTMVMMEMMMTIINTCFHRYPLKIDNSTLNKLVTVHYDPPQPLTGPSHTLTRKTSTPSHIQEKKRNKTNPYRYSTRRCQAFSWSTGSQHRRRESIEPIATEISGT